MQRLLSTTKSIFGRRNDSPSVRFHIDIVNPTVIAGWVWDTSRPDDHVSVQILLNGELVFSDVAKKYRPDLKDAHIGKGDHGFRIQVADLLLPNHCATVERAEPIVTRQKDGRALLSIKFEEAQGEKTVLGEARLLGILSDNDQLTLAPPLSPTIAGWACYAQDPSMLIDCSIYIDGKHITDVTANQPNRLVGLADEFGIGSHAFSAPIPVPFLNGQDHHVIVVAKEYRTPLLVKQSIFNSSRFLATGHVNGVTKDLILRGWACFPSSITDKVDLTITINEQHTFAIIATEYRDDLKALGRSGGFCAFNFPIPPAALKPDTPNKIVVRYFHSGNVVRDGDIKFQPNGKQLLAAQLAWPKPHHSVYDGPKGFTRSSAEFEHERALAFFASLRRVPSARNPLVSVVMPAWNREHTVARAIESVLRQDYSNWELIVADDGSTDGTCGVVERFLIDKRISLVSCEHRGVSGARNAAAERAKGEYIAYLDTDNAWSAYYLSTMIAFLESESLDAAYAALKSVNDEDITYRCADFNWDALLVQNYIDLNVFMHRRWLFERLGGFDTNLKRMVDWDLILRYTRKSKVGYAPFIGAEYNNRSDTPRITNSEAGSFGFAVINKHIIDWQSQKERPREAGFTSIIIPSFNCIELTERCVHSILRNTAEQFELIIVDNGSDAAQKQRLYVLAEQSPHIRVVSVSHNLNFAIGCNLGAAHSCGDNLVFLNNDTLVTPGWLTTLLKPLRQDEQVVGAQPLLIYPDGSVQCAGHYFSRCSTLPYHLFRGLDRANPAVNKPRRLNSLTGACLAVRASQFFDVEGFDAVFVNGCEDTDLCLRMVNRYRGHFIMTPESTVYHLESKSSGRNKHIADNRRVFNERWKGRTPVDDEDILTSEDLVVLTYDKDGPVQTGSAPLLRPRIIHAKALGVIKNILIVKPSGIGNMLLFMPCLQALREIFPAARFTIACYSAEAAVARPLVDDIIALTKNPDTGAADRRELDNAIKQGQFDMAAYPPFSNISAPSEWMKKAIRWHVTHPHIDFEARHELDHNMDVARMLGYRGPTPPILMATKPAPGLDHVERPFIAVHVGASQTSHMQRKKWPFKRWAEVVKILSKDYSVVFVGGTGEESDALAVIAELDDSAASRCHSLVGKLDLAQTASVLSAAEAVLCNDSGLMHMSAALDKPIVTVFGPTSARKNGPVTRTAPVKVVNISVSCGPCFQDREKLLACQDQICLTGVTPEMVIAAFHEIADRVEPSSGLCA